MDSTTQATDSVATQPPPPPLPHITENITSLSTILRKFTEHAYTLLLQTIQTQPTNEAKKKRLLEVIVHLRCEFTRLYVLAKWSRVSAEDFGKLIDILAWLHGQTSHFQNLIWGVMSVNQGLLSAKLPNPDLITALEVLYQGKPTLPSHGLLFQQISSEKILSVLEELNVICQYKYALVKDLPAEFGKGHYEVKDGRITITTKDYEFVISAVAEEAPFTMLAFHFVTNHAQGDDEETDEDILNELELAGTAQSPKLIKTCNEILKRSDFNELQRVLTNYTNTMKLYLIHLKLRALKHVHHSYHPEKFQIVVGYWVNSLVFRNSYIEIGLTKQNEVCYKWYKQGQFVQSFTKVKHVEEFLREVYHRHSQEALSLIDDLTINNKSVLQINEQTGLFYFKNPTPTLNAALRRLNADDFSNINNNLKNLRIELRYKEIATVLQITGWKANDLVRLSQQDLRRISAKFIAVTDGVSQQHLNPRNWKFYTRDEWSSEWCLVLHLDLKIRAYIADITTGNAPSQAPGTTTTVPQSGFKLESFEELNLETFDYKSSKALLKELTKKIMTHLITRELQSQSVVYQTQEFINLILIKTETFVKTSHIKDKKDAKVSGLLYLHFDTIGKAGQQVIDLKVRGKLHCAHNLGTYLEGFVVGTDGVFTISEKVQFRSKKSNGKAQQGLILAGIRSKLTRVMETIDLMTFLESQGLRLESVQIDKLQFSYSTNRDHQGGEDVCIGELTGEKMTTLNLPVTSPHHHIPMLLSKSKSGDIKNKATEVAKDKVQLAKQIAYLHQTTPIVTYLSKLHSIALQATEKIASTPPSALAYDIKEIHHTVIFKSSDFFSVLYHRTNSSAPVAELQIQLHQLHHGGPILYLVTIQSQTEQLNNVMGKDGSLEKEVQGNSKALRWLKKTVVVDGKDVVGVVSKAHDLILNAVKK